MRYICALIGFLVGQCIGELIYDVALVRWIGGLVLGVIAYEIPAFIKYVRATPKQQLAFHGPNAPITKTQSVGEVRAFLGGLHKGGLLLDFHPASEEASVARTQWASLSDAERLTLCQVLMRARILHDDSAVRIRVVGDERAALATYSVTDGYISLEDEEIA
jgi:hypothetical protein